MSGVRGRWKDGCEGTAVTRSVLELLLGPVRIRDLDPESWSRGGREFTRDTAFSLTTRRGYLFRVPQGRRRQDNPDSCPCLTVPMT